MTTAIAATKRPCCDDPSPYFSYRHWRCEHVYYGVCCTCGAVLIRRRPDTRPFVVEGPLLVLLSRDYPALYEELTDYSAVTRIANGTLPKMVRGQWSVVSRPLQLTTDNGLRTRLGDRLVRFTLRLTTLFRRVGLLPRRTRPRTTTARPASQRRAAR